jgi:hypothetical protein
VPEIRRQVVDLALKGSGSRATARVLRRSPTTGIAGLKKSPHASTRHPRVAPSSSTRRPRPRPATARRRSGGNGEFRRGQSDRAVAVACDRSSHRESTCLCEGYPEGAVFLKLKAVLAPLGITHSYTDKAGVYQRQLPPEPPTGGKLTRQKIARKQLMLRTRLKRLARKTLCFSRSCLMHALRIGL